MARTTHGALMSLGTVHMWGFSPAFDLHQHVQRQKEGTEPLNLLLLGPSDVRHVLQTIASRRRYDEGDDELRPLNIYIYETHIEVLARHLLLLRVALDWKLPLRQRCNAFLEIFGNARVQERTSAYIEEKARELIDLMHNEEGFLADFLDLSHLKMKERDGLVEAFQSWFQSVPFNMERLRDQRLRHYFEERYDFRDNLIDWDYTMNLKKIENASVIHVRQYKQWRKEGIAFEFGDQVYSEPNRTLSCYAEARQKGHGAVLCRGYWSDILVSPYVAFGVNCEKPNKYSEQLFDIHNKGTGVEQNRHNATEISVYNLLSFLFEIETGEVYEMRKAHDIYSGIGDHQSESPSNQETPRVEEVVENPQAETDTQDFEKEILLQDARRRARTIVKSLEGVKIIPITRKLDLQLQKQRYRSLFDHVFISSHHTLSLQSEKDGEPPVLEKVLADHATISAESPTFLLILKEQQRALYVNKMVEMATAWGVQPISFSKEHPMSESAVLKMKNTVLHFDYARRKTKNQSSSI